MARPATVIGSADVASAAAAPASAVGGNSRAAATAYSPGNRHHASARAYVYLSLLLTALRIGATTAHTSIGSTTASNATLPTTVATAYPWWAPAMDDSEKRSGWFITSGISSLSSSSTLALDAFPPRSRQSRTLRSARILLPCVATAGFPAATDEMLVVPTAVYVAASATVSSTDRLGTGRGGIRDWVRESDNDGESKAPGCVPDRAAVAVRVAFVAVPVALERLRVGGGERERDGEVDRVGGGEIDRVAAVGDAVSVAVGDDGHTGATSNTQPAHVTLPDALACDRGPSVGPSARSKCVMPQTCTLKRSARTQAAIVSPAFGPSSAMEARVLEDTFRMARLSLPVTLNAVASTTPEALDSATPRRATLVVRAVVRPITSDARLCRRMSIVVADAFMSALNAAVPSNATAATEASSPPPSRMMFPRSVALDNDTCSAAARACPAPAAVVAPAKATVCTGSREAMWPSTTASLTTSRLP
mmetsp:Transcript_29113/g.90018  ORF Transcript_29113/g.90018 Transcript_29113/m.90018 type:complete len:478 (-) Transcript_29113:453-1886(-)